MGQKAEVTSNRVLRNFLDNILIINSYEDNKTIMTRKRHTLFSDGVLPWQDKLLKTIFTELL